MSFDKKNVFEKLRSVKKSIRLAVWCPAIALALGTAGCSTKSDYDLIQGAWRIEGKDERCVFAVETMSMESRDARYWVFIPSKEIPSDSAGPVR